MAFTKKQREWFLRVYGHQCAFYEVINGKWHRCHRTGRLEVHHILPVRASKKWVPGFKRDTCLNGIVLCKWAHHHLVHPDMKPTYNSYRAGNKQAFDEMMHERDELVAQGKVYWDTEWDWMFQKIARRFVYRYIQKHPNDLFPKKGVRSEKYGNP